jgi:hypothetical protein
MALKESTSTTSLTQLAVCDPACTFCSEPEDLEAGRELIDSKQFLSCACRFATHKDCWIMYIDKTPGEPKAKCPTCKQEVVGWQTRFAHATAPEEKKECCSTRTSLVATLFTGLCLVAFVMGFTITHT